MNELDDRVLQKQNFAYLDLMGQDKWTAWTPVFGSLTVVGATNYSGRYRIIGRSCQIQVQFSAATSIASIAGTDYLTLPFTATGYSGIGTMTNDTTNIAVGVCHLDVGTSRLYLPTQNASGNVFNLYAQFEV